MSGIADLIAALHKIRDSYNVNGLGQIAAEATLDDLPYYRANFKKIIATREWLSRELTKLGFRVLPSRTNFILARPPRFSAQAWLQSLRAQKILVRWFDRPEVKDYLRITIGTAAEAEALVNGGPQDFDAALSLWPRHNRLSGAETACQNLFFAVRRDFC